MKRWALLLGVACGPQGAQLELRFDALTDVSALQLVVLTDRKTVDCDAVKKACVRDQFATPRFVPLTDGAGASRLAVRFSPDAGVSVGMSPGKDFAFVIEAISPDRQLAGSSCTYVAEITSGANQVTANALVLQRDAGAVSSCDPSID